MSSDGCGFSNSVPRPRVAEGDRPRRLEQAADSGSLVQVGAENHFSAITSSFRSSHRGIPCSSAEIPCFRIQGNTRRRTPRSGWTEESGLTRKLVSGEFPAVSLLIRDFGRETGSRLTARTAIQAADPETLSPNRKAGRPGAGRRRFPAGLRSSGRVSIHASCAAKTAHPRAPLRLAEPTAQQLVGLAVVDQAARLAVPVVEDRQRQGSRCRAHDHAVDRTGRRVTRSVTADTNRRSRGESGSAFVRGGVGEISHRVGGRPRA